MKPLLNPRMWWSLPVLASFLMMGCLNEAPRAKPKPPRSPYEIGQELNTSSSVSELSAGLKHNDSYVRHVAVRRLNELAPRELASDTIAALRPMLLGDDEDARLFTILILGRVGPAAADAVPELRAELVREGGHRSRVAVLEALGAIGPAAADALPDIVAVRLQGQSMSECEDALSRIDPSRERRLAPYLSAVRRLQYGDRFKSTIQALVSLGEVAVPGLCEVVETSTDVAPIHAALQALQGIRIYSPRVLAVLARSANAEPIEIRRIALAILANDAPPTSDALSALRNEAMQPASGLLDNGRQENAIEALGKLGSDAAPALNELVTLARTEGNESVTSEAVRAIGSIRPQGIPYVIEALKHPKTAIRVTAAEVVSNIGPDAKAAIPDLVEALESDDEPLVIAAMKALGKFGPEAAPHVMAVVRRAGSPSESKIKQAALEVEKLIVPHAVELLGQTLNNGPLEDQRAAVHALQRLNQPAPGAESALISALKVDDGVVRAAAADALGNFGDAASLKAVEGLVSALPQAPAAVEREIVQALGRIGRSAKSAELALLNLVKSSRPHNRVEAAAALKRVSEDTAVLEAAIAALAKDLTHQNVNVVQCAAEGLQHLGASVEIVPDLLRAAAALGAASRARSSISPYPAQQALTDIGPAAVPALIDTLNQPDDALRNQATLVLGNLGEQILPQLLPMLGHTNAKVRRSTAMALARLGPKAEIAREQLGKLIDDEEPTVRNAGAYALARIQPTAEIPLSVIAEALSDTSVFVRKWAVDALAEFKPEPKSAVPQLVIAWVNERSDRDRQAISSLLERLSPPKYRATEAQQSRREIGGLNGLGPEARPAAPGLVALLTPVDGAAASSTPDPAAGVRGRAARALGLIGAMESAPDLEKLLTDTGVYNRTFRSTRYYGSIQTSGPDTSEVRTVRQDAEEALRRMGARSGLRSDDPQDRKRAAARLIALLDESSGVSPPDHLGLEGRTRGSVSATELLPLLADPDRSIRIMVLRALGRPGRATKPVLAGLAKALTDSHAEVKVEALGALEALGPSAQSVGPDIDTALKDSDPGVRWAAAKSLVAVDKSRVDAVLPLLKEGLKDHPREAADTLARIGRAADAKPAVPEIARLMLEERSEVSCKQYMATLGKLGPHAQEALPKLEAIMKGEGNANRRSGLVVLDFDLRRAAYEAAILIDPTATNKMQVAKDLQQPGTSRSP